MNEDHKCQEFNVILPEGHLIFLFIAFALRKHFSKRNYRSFSDVGLILKINGLFERMYTNKFLPFISSQITLWIWPVAHSYCCSFPYTPLVKRDLCFQKRNTVPNIIIPLFLLLWYNVLIVCGNLGWNKKLREGTEIRKISGIFCQHCQSACLIIKSPCI